jgi:hypothetical protein
MTFGFGTNGTLRIIMKMMKTINVCLIMKIICK